MIYGILKNSTNTGLDSEIASVFIVPLRVTSNQPDYVQDAINLKRKASSQNVQRWEIEASIAQVLGDPTMLVHGVLNGHHQVFPIRMPQVALLKTTTNTVTLAADIVAGCTTLNIVGADSLVAGEFFNLGSDPKVYLVTDGGSGGAGVMFEPRLRKNALAGTAFTLGAVTMQARYDTNTQLGILYNDGILSDPGSITFVEDLA
jgi:hypothetical protein